jgi:hypothetical protein
LVQSLMGFGRAARSTPVNAGLVKLLGDSLGESAGFLQCGNPVIIQ